MSGHLTLDKVKARIIDMVPSSWFRETEGSSIWVTGYRVLRVPQESFARGPRVIDLGEVRAVILFGTITCLDSREAKIEIITENQWRLDASAIHGHETPEGAYLLLLAPFDVDGTSGNEAITRQKIGVAAGLFAAFNGRNMVYERLIDNVLSMTGDEATVMTPVWENPFSFVAPDVSDTRLDVISSAYRIIASLPQSDQNRVFLSLRWFESALYERGVDSCLKYWIALETLGMLDTTNVHPLNEILSHAYNLSCKEARDRFKLGRLHGLRSRIVHGGQIIPIHAQLLEYIEALYVDILFEHLGLSCERRAEEAMNKPGFALDAYLHER